MSNSDDLDDLFGPLRSTATRAELANEASAVDAMAHAHNASKGRITMLNSRKARVATLIAAGIIGFGGIAAAGPGGFQSLELPDAVPVESSVPPPAPDQPDEPEVPEVEEDPEPQPPEEAIVLVEEDPPPPSDGDQVAEAAPAEGDVLEGDEPLEGIEFVEANCVEGNHGKTVSAVAHAHKKFADEEDNKFVGADVEVRDAAHSNCGKSEAEDGEETEAEHVDAEKEADDGDSDHDHESHDESDHDEDDGDEDSDDDDDDDDHDEKAEKPAKKNGNSASKDKGSNGRGKNKKGD